MFSVFLCAIVAQLTTKTSIKIKVLSIKTSKTENGDENRNFLFFYVPMLLN